MIIVRICKYYDTILRVNDSIICGTDWRRGRWHNTAENSKYAGLWIGFL